MSDAVIYCRISSTKQIKVGDRLNSQETRCRAYARMKDYNIIKTFHDEGVSGSLADLNPPPEVFRMAKDLMQLKRKADALLERTTGTDDAPSDYLLRKYAENGRGTENLLCEQLAFTPTRQNDFEEPFRTPLAV